MATSPHPLVHVGSVHNLPRRDVLGNIGTMAFAGFDTSNTTEAWALYDIASHPEVQTKLKAELRAAGLLHSKAGGAGRALAWDDLSQPYFSAVVKESMRLHPVAGQSIGWSTYVDWLEHKHVSVSHQSGTLRVHVKYMCSACIVYVKKMVVKRHCKV